MDQLHVREVADADIGSCAAILDALPDWFGIQEVNAGYVAGLLDRPGFVAVDSDGAVVGFLGMQSHTTTSAEILVMGVEPTLHRRGVGRLLVTAAVSWCAQNGFRWLHVKTRGPSTYDDGYEKTRRFYLAVGFDVLYESFTEWGEEDAALILVMDVG